jgi:hypothetical protein
MADIIISRQQYDATDANQKNGWKPNVISGAITGTSMSSGTTYEIPADFKDHKTVFVIQAQADANVTFKAGDTYHAVKDLMVECKAGTNMIWLDSADFINNTTGKISVETSAAVTMFGYEMR